MDIININLEMNSAGASKLASGAETLVEAAENIARICELSPKAHGQETQVNQVKKFAKKVEAWAKKVKFSAELSAEAEKKGRKRSSEAFAERAYSEYLFADKMSDAAIRIKNEILYD